MENILELRLREKVLLLTLRIKYTNIKIDEDEECTIEVKITAKKKNIAGVLVDKIKSIAADGHPSFKTIEELEPFGLNEDSEIVIDSILNGNKRPISISKLKTPNISQLITVSKTEDGYAEFNSMREESLKLFKDIVNYK